MDKVRNYSNSIRVIVAVINVILITCVVLSVRTALISAEDTSFSQNIENIRTLTDASAEKIELEYAHHTKEIRKIAACANQYHNIGMTEEQLVAFLDDLYDLQDTTCRWELVDSQLDNQAGASRGFSAYIPGDAKNSRFSYSAQAYPELAKIFCAASEETIGEVHCTSEFTDSSPALEKVSAITSVVRLRTENGYEYKTLMLLLKNTYIRDLLASNHDLSTLTYFDYSSIIVDRAGNYVISNEQFQGTNFMDYMALYNDSFTKERVKELSEKLQQPDYNDVLFYHNNRNQDCAYTIVTVQDSDWYILSIVPLDSFHNDYRFGNRFILFVVLFGLLFLVDIAFVMFINRKLSHRTKEAQVASEAKTDFLSRMSHDIRTPINVINGMTELAIHEDNPPATKEYLDDIRASSAFLLGLVNDILDMNKVESGKMELHPGAYPYAEFKSYINAIILPMCISKNILFTLKCEPENLVLCIDKMRLNQIFFNLLSNAVKFSPENGHVALDITVTKIKTDRAQLNFSVSDDGIGMSDEFQKNMFSAFSQEDRQEEQQMPGTGLGLAIVKNLVEIMGGSIRVESAVGKGTTFYVQLETDLSDQMLQTDSRNCHDFNLRGRRVLLCEDQPLNTKIIVRLLEREDIIIETAENGKIGVDMLRSSEPGYYDAVLMDVRMPVMNGLDAAKAIRATEEREDLYSIPIIALTANAYDTDVQACLDAGMNEHLAKPVDSRQLLHTLAELINHENEAIS
ncbi:MAG: ATP-binding protein [bacterium]|nr:ATP-binding protein [bacterium]